MGTEIHRLQGETDEAYVQRIVDHKSDIGSWQVVADLIAQECGINHSESFYRKKHKQGRKVIPRLQKHTCSQNVNNDDVSEQMQELERNIIQFRDERNELNKQKRLGARVANALNHLEKELCSIGSVQFSKHESVQRSSDNDILVILSDLHIGAFYDSVFGKYNSDIAKQRLEKLLNRIVSIARQHGSQNCYVSIQGDCISGNIHRSLAVANRENVNEQVKIASELIASFCHELSKEFVTVYVTSVVGNHSRMDKKDDALHDERLDDLVCWSVKNILSHIDNINVYDKSIDSGISVFDIRGNKYVAVHGDYDAYSKNGVARLTLLLGFIPHAVLFGHMHSCALDEVSGVKMVRGGCLCGSGDSYTIEKRLAGKPSQMVCVCNSSGIDCYYPVDLV